MSDLFGALAQSVPAATTLTDTYTCPASKRATVQVTLCNQGAATSVRLSHAINGAADALAQYLLYGFALAVGEAKVTAKFTMKAGDKIRAYSVSGNVAFNINGIEEDA